VLPSLEAIATLFERAEILESEGTVRGYVGEQHVTVALKAWPYGSSTMRGTEARAAVPEDLVLWVRQRTERCERWLKEGLAVDIRVGDEQFDAAFMVEAAPAWMARELFGDEEIRRGLLALEAREPRNRPNEAGIVLGRPGDLLVSNRVTDDAPRTFTVTISGWVKDAESAALLVRTTARLGKVGAEIARLGRTHDAPGYRGDVASGRRQRDEDEVREMMLRLAKREKQQTKIAWIVAGVVILLLALVVVGMWLGIEYLK
jgi:hypothetical protein